jgi:hypothetical protein
MTRILFPRVGAPELPEICVATGATTGVRMRPASFVFVPTVARFAIVFCGLIGMIAALVMTKRATLVLPFTDEAWERWTRAKTVFLVVVIGGVACLVACAIAGYFYEGIGAFLVLLIGALVYHFVVVKPAGPSCVDIDEAYVTLELPNREASLAIGDRLDASARKPATPPRDRYDDLIDREIDRL